MAKNDRTLLQVYTRGISSDCFSQLGLSPWIIQFLYKHKFGMNLDAMSLLFVVLLLLYSTPPYLMIWHLCTWYCSHVEIHNSSLFQWFQQTYLVISLWFFFLQLCFLPLRGQPVPESTSHMENGLQNWSWQWSLPTEQQPLPTQGINTHHL